MTRVGLGHGEAEQRVRVTVPEQGELPFVVGVVADFVGALQDKPLHERRFTEIDRDNFDDVLARLKPRARCGEFALAFESLKDFEPESLVERVPALAAQVERRRALVALRRRAVSDADVARSLGRALSDQSVREDVAEPRSSILKEILAGEDAHTRDDVDALVRELARKAPTGSQRADQILDGEIEELDHDLGRQLDAILHDPDVQRLEGAWRGLRYLVFQTSTSATLKIRMLSATKAELADPEPLRKLVCEELETFGGEPFSLLVCDYAWTRDDPPWDDLAADANAPVLTNAAEDGPESESRLVFFAGPRVLARRPYGEQSKKVRGFNYEEGLGRSCWCSATYALAERLTDSFERRAWWAIPLDPLEKIPLGESGPLETRLAKPAERPGHVSLMWDGKRPPLFAASALPHRLAVSRFALTLRGVAGFLMRGGITDEATLQAGLNAWVSDYVHGEGEPASSKRPLTEARVHVEGDRATADLRAGYGLGLAAPEPLRVSFRLP